MPLPTAIATDLSTLALAQALAERLVISPQDWHRLKANRKAQASQDLAAAIVYLLNDHPEEALNHIKQAEGWLDRSISAPPCPSHGHNHHTK
ncbi:MAG: DUF6439 family protein [Woronichinia naegeliana WA131]|jgi:hypothetical protein|uniref:DUF6439 family protein n=1 Tax=Woronichinia naegeliana WA131 TaxID=2824559 RepID=A0A977KV13_9CYAN|nr:MAG: DUF6439 family protein [Woronichinia naegeliana WA131]